MWMTKIIWNEIKSSANYIQFLLIITILVVIIINRKRFISLLQEWMVDQLVIIDWGIIKMICKIFVKTNIKHWKVWIVHLTFLIWNRVYLKIKSKTFLWQMTFFSLFILMLKFLEWGQCVLSLSFSIAFIGVENISLNLSFNWINVPTVWVIGLILILSPMSIFYMSCKKMIVLN